MVLANNELVKRDIVLNPEAEYQIRQIYPLFLRDVNAEINVLIETVYDHETNFEIYGKFWDDGRWYNLYLSTWKDDNVSPARVKLTPWQNTGLTIYEKAYIDRMKKNV